MSKAAKFTPAQRGHARRTAWAMGAYVALLMPVVWLHAHPQIVPVQQTAMRMLSLLPATAVLTMFNSYRRYLEDETDEYVRMLMVRQVLFATNVAMSCAVLWGFLSELGGMPAIANYWIAVVWMAAQGVYGCIQARKNRAQGDEA